MRLALLLLLLACGLSWLSIEFRQMTLVTASPAPTQAAETRAVAPLPTPSTGAPEIAALFRPISALTEETPQPGQTFVLSGLVGRDGTRVALLRDIADQTTISARVGDRVGVWTLADLSDRCAVLARASRRIELCLS